MTRKLQLAGPTARHAPVERPFEAIDPADVAADGQARARREGADYDEIAFRHLREQGATILCCQHQVGVVSVDAHVRGANGAEYRVLAHGNVDPDTTAKLPGLRRTDTIRKAGFSAWVLGRTSDPLPVLLLTSHMPTAKRKDKAARQTLRATTELIFDVICTNSFRDLYRLRHYLTMTPAPNEREPADWTNATADAVFEQLSFDTAADTIGFGPEEPF